ncbi:Acyl-CoA dehydrogenase, C-terminal domain [Teratosphaeria destructans]|uniref:Acyl-CoA dehydrogenase, C-terminal domain n=1 Tax=Teratosphaeria destructans TaxID=418781 RepID=A0A9W7SXA7_9PEZI|nr:Acyl-CoA dehydrogenase, C-terminal domain [Teratosphaeria destructans]
MHASRRHLSSLLKLHPHHVSSSTALFTNRSNATTLTTARKPPHHPIQRRTFVAKATEYLPMYPDYDESQATVREAISKICSRFPESYWLDIDSSARWPSEFQEAVARDGWLGIMMPSRYGGSELGLAEATVMMQTIAESGGGYTASSSVHMNIFGLAPVVKYGSEEQKERSLIPLIQGKERACFAVTEPNTGLDTLKLQSLATRDGDDYILKGSKIWTSTAQVAEKILILVRTKPLQDCTKSTEGLTLFYTTLDRTQVSVTEIKKMGRAAVDTNSLHFDAWRVPATDRIGAEGDGFKMIMHGMNAERILLSGEAVGIGYAALRHAANYARDRVVFGRPIGQNQGIQHPLAKAWCALEGTRSMVMRAARMWDEGFGTGEYANAVKYLAGEHAFTACETAVCCMGGMGYAREYHVERFLREVIIPRLAPVSREMCLNYIAEKVLEMPRSY